MLIADRIKTEKKSPVKSKKSKSTPFKAEVGSTEQTKEGTNEEKNDEEMRDEMKEQMIKEALLDEEQKQKVLGEETKE